ncbi:MAG: hypothetical protein A2V65_12315 [Deltaproteobacteria bacterium RBG_13_49_15]|nr:MAG: hypothetical protein A2V65_12315 [Deltaproteobacteria bacterium RBG_13_49_15]
MGKGIAVCLMASFIFIGNISADESWLIEEGRRHVSAHGQITCLECHHDISQKKFHPDPAKVNSNPRAFFRADRCESCHQKVYLDIKEEKHAGNPLKTDQDYRHCTKCHDPHYQLRLSKTARHYDPSQPCEKQCGVCHELKEHLPALSVGDEACMACHRRLDPNDPREVLHSKVLCLICRGRQNRAGFISEKSKPTALNISSEGFWPHEKISCLMCHPEAARFGHADQQAADCRKCHTPHNDKVIHDGHAGVSCEACHLKSIFPRKDAQTGAVIWLRMVEDDTPSVIHNMIAEKTDRFCSRCHIQGNPVGAAAMILPPKSILCMPCHAATFSSSDPITILALIIFGFGTASAFSYWLSGAWPGKESAGIVRKIAGLIGLTIQTVFSQKILLVARALFLDGLLQLQLYRRSTMRWLVHGLIVWPLTLRFGWGMIALIGSLWMPETRFPWLMLNKNHPICGFVFDFTGVMIISGAVMAIVRNIKDRPMQLPSLPKKDRLATGLIGTIVLVGFALEAIRIAMTDFPPGSGYAFIGNGAGRLFIGMTGLDSIYGYIWYVHAALAGIFIAYLPFSGMFHIILAPVVLAINAVRNRS